jgi:hypothetical protein
MALSLRVIIYIMLNIRALTGDLLDDQHDDTDDYRPDQSHLGSRPY